MAASMQHVKLPVETDQMHPFVDHPKYQEMKTYGFKSSHIQLALLVYLDLVENKAWWNVTVMPCNVLQTAVVLGHPSQRERREVVVPLSCEDDWSLQQLDNMHDAIAALLPQTNSVLLGLVDNDSAVVYFRLQPGLHPPAPPEQIDEKVARQKKRIQRRSKRFKMFNVAAREIESAASKDKTSDSKNTNL